MNKVVEFLNANPVQYLATVGRDGKAKCRPFMFAGALDGKLWFCTNNTKDVYKDMQLNPEVEISVSSPEYAWLRLHGKAVFENNKAAKEMCIQNPIGAIPDCGQSHLRGILSGERSRRDRRFFRESALRILIEILRPRRRTKLRG